MRFLRRARSQRGQSTSEYMLTLSVLVIAMGAVFYELVASGGSAPISKAFENQRGVIEAPYP